LAVAQALLYLNWPAFAGRLEKREAGGLPFEFGAG